MSALPVTTSLHLGPSASNQNNLTTNFSTESAVSDIGTVYLQNYNSESTIYGRDTVTATQGSILSGREVLEQLLMKRLSSAGSGDRGSRYQIDERGIHNVLEDLLQFHESRMSQMRQELETKMTSLRSRQDQFEERLLSKVEHSQSLLNQDAIHEKEQLSAQLKLQAIIDAKNAQINGKDVVICEMQEKLNQKLAQIERLQGGSRAPGDHRNDYYNPYWDPSIVRRRGRTATTTGAAGAGAAANGMDDENDELPSEVRRELENIKNRQVMKAKQPDRMAWTHGTKILIYSNRLGGWRSGTVTNVKKNKEPRDRDLKDDSTHWHSGANDEFTFLDLTITYGPPTHAQHLRKFVNRFQDHVKSTKEFVDTRKMWNTGSKVEVYLKLRKETVCAWFPGEVEQIVEEKDSKDSKDSSSSSSKKSSGNEKKIRMNDKLKIQYTLNGKERFGFLHRWSDELRAYDSKRWNDGNVRGQYKKGSKVVIWSNGKRSWCQGKVSQVMEKLDVVNVRYADHEKWVAVHSSVIRPFVDNFNTVFKPMA